MEFDQISIDGHDFKALDLTTEQAHLLLIQTKKGFLGCGYFSIETANKLGESAALVSGVNTYQDCLEAKVHTLSEAAINRGLVVGMSGREALLALNA
jgi:uncharacterized protein YunC (DUF1805 family)